MIRPRRSFVSTFLAVLAATLPLGHPSQFIVRAQESSPSATPAPTATPSGTKPAASGNSASGSPAASIQLSLPSLGGPRTEPPKGKEPAADDLVGQLLFSTGIDDLLLAKFDDGRPLDGVERMPLVGLFSSIRQFKPSEIEEVIQVVAKPEALADWQARGKLWKVAGRLKSITFEEFTNEEIDRIYPDVIFRLKEDQPHLPADDVRRFFFRSELEFGDRKVTVVTLRMPSMLLAKYRNLSEHPLKVGETITLDERVAVDGIYIKSLGAAVGDRPVIVASRPAWYPDTPLGKLGMDYGLYDEVRATTSDFSQERECFFQLLAAMKRAKFDDLLDATTENYSVVPLFNESASMRGKLTALTGTARRATLVNVPYHDIRRRFGIDHYYEVAIFTGDSRDNPLLFDLLELPPGFPEGDDIHVEVRIPGTFLSGFTYERDATDKEQAQGVKPKAQKAPLLIGKTLYRYQDKSSNVGTFDWYVSGLVAIGALALGVVGWATMRGDRRTRKIMEKTNAPPAGTSLNDLPGDFKNGPDFSNLE